MSRSQRDSDEQNGRQKCAKAFSLAVGGLWGGSIGTRCDPRHQPSDIKLSIQAYSAGREGLQPQRHVREIISILEDCNIKGGEEEKNNDFRAQEEASNGLYCRQKRSRKLRCSTKPNSVSSFLTARSFKLQTTGSTGNQNEGLFWRQQYRELQRINGNSPWLHRSTPWTKRIQLWEGRHFRPIFVRREGPIWPLLRLLFDQHVSYNVLVSYFWCRSYIWSKVKVMLCKSRRYVFSFKLLHKPLSWVCDERSSVLFWLRNWRLNRKRLFFNFSKSSSSH